MENEKPKKSMEELLVERGKDQEFMKKEKALLEGKTAEELIKYIYLPESASTNAYFHTMEEVYAKTVVDGFNALKLHLSGHPWFDHLRFTFSMVMAPRSFFEVVTFSAYRYYVKCSIGGALYKELVQFPGTFDTFRMMMIDEDKLQQALMILFHRMIFDAESTKYIMTKRRVSEDYEFFRLTPPSTNIPTVLKDD